MMDDDLFDVFDAEPTKQKSPLSREKAPKRQHSGDGQSVGSPVARKTDGIDEIATENGDDKMDTVMTDGPDTHAAKRQKREERPVVTDAVETVQSREVASSAGLQAKTETSSIVLQHQMRHQVALPPGYDYVPISQHVPHDPPARKYNFELDPFQRTSINAIERNESVLVSAHTSAGKTVVAEYAIAKSLKANQRVIYTSPIKALSNQKYREFMEEFSDVGLMTGDVTINPSATCLVMTTEILRSMLYRGGEVMREVQWVIFDEIHYMRDKSRGVVWEETIILLPDKVRYVFLSATIPNAMQFAEWISKIHVQPCHVVYTNFRPTPLQNYLFPAGAEGIHLVVDEKGVFREDNFQKAMASLGDKMGDDPGDINGKKFKSKKKGKTNTGGNKNGPSDIYKIVKMIMLKNYNPVIVFSFSKRECEALALQMSQLSFNEDAEKSTVNQVFTNAISSLSEEDRTLPQITHIIPLLRRGIGIHHSGLLPILKEVIEILFQEGLIKVLFATETFSIGLNMPAKTVVFTNVRKFDGISQRWLSPSEYIQMSGRAGRRGLDDRGIVILMVDEKMEPHVAREIVKGEQDRLNSAFYLGYNMILNLMRVEGVSPEYMLNRCFFQFQNTSGVSDLEAELAKLEEDRSTITIEDESMVKDYYDTRHQIEKYTGDMRDVINHPSYCLNYLTPGRLVRIKHKNYDFGWGVIVKFTKRIKSKHMKEDFPPQQSYILDVLINIASDSTVGIKSDDELPPGVRPPIDEDTGRMEVVPVVLSCLNGISSVCIFLPRDLKSLDQRNLVRKNVEEVKRRFPDGIAVLDPIENMNIRDDSFKKLLRKIEVLEAKLLANALHNSPRLPGLYDSYSYKVDLATKIKEVKKKISEAHAVIKMEELRARKRVLRRLGFIDESDVVQLKARVACEISSGDELLLSELLFNRVFNELSPELCAALLSCFVFEEKSNEGEQLKEELAKPYRELVTQARLIAKISVESKVPLVEEEYIQKFKPQLMDVVYSWTQGASFATICKMTDVYEGSLIRVFRRLEELIRQMAAASKVMGSEDLEQKFETALTKVKRDIVAAQSLYL